MLFTFIVDITSLSGFTFTNVSVLNNGGKLFHKSISLSVPVTLNNGFDKAFIFILGTIVNSLCFVDSNVKGK